MLRILFKGEYNSRAKSIRGNRVHRIGSQFVCPFCDSPIWVSFRIWFAELLQKLRYIIPEHKEWKEWKMEVLYQQNQGILNHLDTNCCTFYMYNTLIIATESVL